MEKEKIELLVKKQQEYFHTGETLPVSFRKAALNKLYTVISAHEEDLGKGSMEAFMCEAGLTLSEISHMQKHLNKYAAPKRVRTPITNFHSASIIRPCPRGCVLIMSPWNYPFLLSMEPLVDAVAAGNTVILKTSAYSPATSAVIEKIISEGFPDKYIAVVTGGREENSSLLTNRFDHIFFTGSQAVGKEVLRHAAENLTPVTLELGGKSPCIVDATANIKLAARRIVFGKFLNCGQTCVAPDYILCDEKVRDELTDTLRREIIRQFGEKPLENNDYGKIINKKHFDRLLGLIDSSKVVFGGGSDEATLRIEPTVMENVTFEDKVMQEEIFGPVLPVITYNSLKDAMEEIEMRQHPLALYIFSRDRGNIEMVTSKCRYGGGCVNDVVVHLATSEMPFGGFGESGMGAYHGKYGFDTFTHYKSILDKKEWIDLPMRYQRYTKLNEKLLRMFLK